MAVQNILQELIPGFPTMNPSDTDRERAVSVAVKEYVEAWSHGTFVRDMLPKIGSINEDELVVARLEHAQGMARVVQIAGALDELFPDQDGLPWEDIIESISLTDTDPRTGVSFEPVA